MAADESIVEGKSEIRRGGERGGAVNSGAVSCSVEEMEMSLPSVPLLLEHLYTPPAASPLGGWRASWRIRRENAVGMH